MLPQMKKCGGVHKRNQWQSTSNCKNGSGLDINLGRIPLPERKWFSVGTPKDNVEEAEQGAAGGE
jgi:hypothetical protein